MMRTTKKPEYLRAAEAAVKAKKAERDAAKEALAMADKDMDKARSDLLAARIEADSTLPKCRAVHLRWPAFKEDGAYSELVVIVRKTLGGRLVVREVGYPKSTESQFYFDPYDRVFRIIRKRSSYGNLVELSSRNLIELRDVPDEFMPARKSETGETK